MPQWTVTEPQQIAIDGPVNAVRVGLVAGTINVVGTDGPARVEVTEQAGDPLEISLTDGVLTVGYPEFSFGNFLDKLSGIVSIGNLPAALRARKRRCAVSVAVPTSTDVKIGMVNAEGTVSNIAGDVTVNSVSGDTTLVDVAGRIHASTVSGTIDAQAVAGNLKLSTVSGDVTVVSGKTDHVNANTVSGSVILDLDTDSPTAIKVNTVSGDIGIRLPATADATVVVGSTSGKVTSTFDQLQIVGSWGWRRLQGRLGSGIGDLSVSTVSGAVTVQRRPEPEEDRPVDAQPETLEDF